MNHYFTNSMDYVTPEPRHRLCLQSGMVTLQQRGKDNFLVRYGKQVKGALTYSQAATEFGACLMHQAACDDLLDNHSKQGWKASHEIPRL